MQPSQFGLFFDEYRIVITGLERLVVLSACVGYGKYDLSLFAVATSDIVRNGGKARFWTSSWSHGHLHGKRKNCAISIALKNGLVCDILHHLFDEIISENFQYSLVIRGPG